MAHNYWDRVPSWKVSTLLLRFVVFIVLVIIILYMIVFQSFF